MVLGFVAFVISGVDEVPDDWSHLIPHWPRIAALLVKVVL